MREILPDMAISQIISLSLPLKYYFAMSVKLSVTLSRRTMTCFIVMFASVICFADSYPEPPATIVFCEKKIDLLRFDRRENMDRELMSFTYMHTNSTLLLKRSKRMFSVIEPILREHGIPDDFKYLAAIESSLSPTARSAAGAAGTWQLLQGTARQYGLEVNANVDERFDVAKSTEAACKYLKQAYEKYGDWMLVVASYNAGMQRIGTLVDQQGVNDALDLYMVEETARYVYRILAAKVFFAQPKNFGFHLKTSDIYAPVPCREITVNYEIGNLADWAKEQGTTYALIKLLNPWLRENKLNNKSKKQYIIKIPKL